MSPGAPDPWRVKAIERLGAQFRDLESAEHEVRVRAAGRRRRRISISGVLAAAAIAILTLVLTGRVANALSPINRAPAAAAASESVRFHSTITITVNGGQRTRRNRLRTTKLPHDAPVGPGRRRHRAASRRRRSLCRATTGWAQSTYTDPVARVPSRARSRYYVRVSSRKRGVHEPPGAAGRAWRHPRSSQGRGHGRPRRRTDHPLSAPDQPRVPPERLAGRSQPPSVLPGHRRDADGLARPSRTPSAGRRDCRGRILSRRSKHHDPH